MASKIGGGDAANRHMYHQHFSRNLRDMIAFGAVEHWYHVGVMGRNDSVGTTAEDLTQAGGVMVWPSAAATVSVVSTSTADDTGGTGAITVLLEGLDASYLEISETVTLDGTTPVVTTQSFLRVNSAGVATAGTGEANAGDISCSIGGNVQRFIATGDGLCHCSQYTVPAGYTAYLTEVTTTQGKDAGADCWITVKDFTEQVWKKVVHLACYRNDPQVDLAGSVVIQGKADIKMAAASITATVDQTGYYVLYMFKAGN